MRQGRELADTHAPGHNGRVFLLYKTRILANGVCKSSRELGLPWVACVEAFGSPGRCTRRRAHPALAGADALKLSDRQVVAL